MTEQEWMTIYRETVRDLYGYVARRTGGIRELSEDIVQEAYLRALEIGRAVSSLGRKKAAQAGPPVLESPVPGNGIQRRTP